MKSESEIADKMVEVLETCGEPWLRMKDVKKRLLEILTLDYEDVEVLPSRPDTRVEQIIRNIVSHRFSSKKNPIYKKRIWYNNRRLGIPKNVGQVEASLF